MILFVHLQENSVDHLGFLKCRENEYTFEDIVHLGIQEALEQIEQGEDYESKNN